jgi:hypothetical protein
MQETIDTCDYLQKMQFLGQDVCRLSRYWDLDQQHLTILGAKRSRMSMCLAHSRPPITFLPRSMHAALSPYTGVSFFCARPRQSRSARRYKTSQPAIDAE